MSGSTIGIKIADGSYYPVLQEGYTGKKKLTLTTVKDSQSKVQIDLYRGEGDNLDSAQYIGSLIIENIPSAPRGKPDIELLVGLDSTGELSAEASDRSTGESQSFAISLKTLSAEETYEIPEFEMEGEAVKTTIAAEETPLTGEAYHTGERDSRKEHFERRGPNTWLIVLFIVLGIALLAAIGYFVYSRVTSAQTAEAGTPAVAEPEPAPVAATPAPEPAVTPTPAVEPAAAAPASEPVTQAQSEPGGVAIAPKPAEPAAPQAGVTYRIKKGDTLWDISATYYRNPWLYPKLAKANNIKNPDLIFADTKIFIPQE